MCYPQDAVQSYRFTLSTTMLKFSQGKCDLIAVCHRQCWLLCTYVGLSTSFGQIIPLVVPYTYTAYLAKPSELAAGTRHKPQNTDTHTDIGRARINCATVFICAALWFCMWPMAINAPVQAQCKSIQNKYSSRRLSGTPQAMPLKIGNKAKKLFAKQRRIRMKQSKS